MGGARMKKFVAWLIVGTGFAGCGGGSNVTVGDSTVKGVVGGVVLDAAAGLAPLDGVTATVIAGGIAIAAPYDKTAGTYSAKDIPVGPVVGKPSAVGHF